MHFDPTYFIYDIVDEIAKSHFIVLYSINRLVCFDQMKKFTGNFSIKKLIISHFSSDKKKN